MTVSRYQSLPTYLRKDSLAADDYNRIRDNASWVQRAFASEHVFGSAEHNSPMISRSAGALVYSAGYSLTWSNTDAVLGAGHNPAVGKVIITLLGNRPYSAAQMMVQAQNASGNGGNVPCISTARAGAIVGGNPTIEVYSQYWTGALGVPGGAWAAENPFAQFITINSYVIQQGLWPSLGKPLGRGNGVQGLLTTSAWNQLIQSTADLKALIDFEHSSGEHNVEEIPKTFARVQWNSAASRYQIVAQYTSPSTHATHIETISRSATGLFTLRTRGALSGRTKVFLAPDYTRAANGVPSDIYITNIDGLASGSSLAGYIYKRSVAGAPLQEQWDRADTDFYVWMYML